VFWHVNFGHELVELANFGAKKKTRNEPSMTTDRHSWKGTTHWLPGLVLVGIGTLILLDHLNVINGERIWRYWPLLLIAVGLAKVVNEGRRVGGVLLIVVGVAFMGEHLGYRLFTWSTLWPVLLIVAGLAMIWGRFDRPQFRQNVSGDGRDTVQATALFGGVERRVNLKNFRTGGVSAVMGGVELDFRGADIEGEEAILEVEAVFGGIEITVPEQWQVIFEGESIFGGYSDETRAPVVDAMGTQAKKHLILRGRCVFGGISVKN
jgi:predicted membrane protein